MRLKALSVRQPWAWAMRVGGEVTPHSAPTVA
jgi:hypothetical protein